MQEILEFSEIEILEKNPNPVNDIYKKDGTEGSVSSIVAVLWISILMTFSAVIFLWFVVLGIRTNGGDGMAYFEIILLCVGGYVNILWVKVNIRDIYRACGYRKKILANGRAYSGIVAEVEVYSRRFGTTLSGPMRWGEYTMRIKYAEDSFWVSGLETDPRKCLENPYCTVYVWNGKAIATDFKLKDEYIAKNGKEYLTIPKK